MLSAFKLLNENITLLHTKTLTFMYKTKPKIPGTLHLEDLNISFYWIWTFLPP